MPTFTNITEEDFSQTIGSSLQPQCFEWMDQPVVSDHQSRFTFEALENLNS